MEQTIVTPLMGSEQWDCPENLVNLCRVCAQSDDHMIPIFGENLRHDLSSKINTYLLVNLKEDDKLPLQVCDNCAGTILAWHDLVSGWNNAQQKLMHIQAKLEAKKKEQEEIAAKQANLAIQQTKRKRVFLKILKEKKQNSSQEVICISDDDERSASTHSKNKSVLPVDPQRIEEESRDDESDDQHEASFDKLSMPMLKKHKSLKIPVHDSMRRHLTKEDIKKYEKVKDGKVYYRCNDCGKNLRSPYTLFDHMRIHTGEKPYVCYICDEAYRLKRSLVKHILSKHADHV